MNKLFLLAGAVLAAFIIVQIHEEKLDVFMIRSIIEPEMEGVVFSNYTPLKIDFSLPRRFVPNISISPGKDLKEDGEDSGVEPYEHRELSILAFGDMMLGRYVATLMQRHDRDYVFEGVKDEDGNFFWDADVVHANLEGPILGEGISGGTSMVFAFHEDVAPFLKESGFDVLSIANNHSLDRGWPGRDNTIRALEEAGVGWCGHPTEAAPESVYYGSDGLFNGIKFAFVCFQDVSHRLNREAALDLIAEVSAKVDFLIVSVHWGHEYRHSPDHRLQVEPGRAFVDAGADLVIGHHPHVVQTFEIYNDRFIFYSLGNFVFDQYWSQATQEGLAIGVVLKETESPKVETIVHLFPMKSETSKSRLMEGAERDEWIERFLNYGDYDEEIKAMVRAGVVTSD